MSDYFSGPRYIRKSIMVIENGELILKSGQQWKSDSFEARSGSIAMLGIRTDQKIYYGIFSLNYYNQKTLNGTKMIDFPFGSDNVNIYEPYIIGTDGDFVVVIRLSVFNQIAHLTINLEVIGPREQPR